MTTSERSQPHLFATDADQSTSSAAASPARTSAQPDAVPASTLRGAASGGQCSALSERFAQLGCSLRTYLLFALAARTTYSLRWNRSTTPAGRSWWELGAPARLIGETGSGLWPTARVRDLKGASGKASGEIQAAKGHPRSILAESVQQWSTPNAMDAMDTTDMMPEEWAARNVAAKAANPNLGALQKSLRSVVHWPTPRERDWKGESQRGTDGPMDALPNLVALTDGPPDPANLSTNGKRREWCTPNVGDGRGQMDGGSNSRKAAKARGREVPRGSLNPTWVSQLMGYPDGWLEVESPPNPRRKNSRHGDGTRFARSETP